MGQIHKVEIITRPEKLNDLKEAMYAIRVTGMTVMQVYGCGLSHGYTEIYRGQEMTVNLLPKIKVEIVVSEIPVEMVVEAAKKACCTGHIGDGKIFVSSIDDAVRIRTGESGSDAIRDRDDEAGLIDEVIK